MDHRLVLGLTALLTLLPACAGGSATPSQKSGSAGSVSPPVRLVAAVRSAPPTVSSDLNTIIPGTGGIDRLVSSGLTVTNDEGVRVAQLAEAVPTTENGLWRLFPDGRMETTWRIRPGAQWHDLQPLSSSDFAFTAKVRQDRDLSLFANNAFRLVEAVNIPDERTVVVQWKQPFIDADTLFGDAPLPAHLLEKVYSESKETFEQVPYWSEGFIGTGPYKVREFSAGQHIFLQAFEQYIHGKAKIQEIEVRFIPDGATLIANILSGVVQLTFGERNLSYEEAAEASQQWRDGAVVPHQRSTVLLHPQFIDSTPTLIGSSVQFRRALLHAMDREELARAFQGGLSSVPHGYLSPDVAEYREIQDVMTRYDYDPRRAAAMIAETGYSRNDIVEVRTTTASENQKIAFAVADYWERAGIASQPHIIPQARAQDAEYRSTFPGFEIVRAGNGKGVLTGFHSSRTRLAENNYRAAGNRSRYMNPDLDLLIDRYQATIPWQARMAVVREIIRLETDQVVIAGIIYSADANMISNRLENITQSLWNVHMWGFKERVSSAAAALARCGPAQEITKRGEQCGHAQESIRPTPFATCAIQPASHRPLDSRLLTSCTGAGRHHA